MPHDDSSYPMDWLRIAEKDLKRVSVHIDTRDYEAAGFFLQQAMEKFLKAFLLSKGWKLERIHDLESLLNSALVYDPSIEEYREVCQLITWFYFIERYPLLSEIEITKQDVIASFEVVESFINKLRAEITDSS